MKYCEHVSITSVRTHFNWDLDKKAEKSSETHKESPALVRKAEL